MKAPAHALAGELFLLPLFGCQFCSEARKMHKPWSMVVQLLVTAEVSTDEHGELTYSYYS